MSGGLLDSLFGTAEVTTAFADRARLQGMLDFEGALARAEAALGVIPTRAAVVIVRACDARLYDVDELGHAAAEAGNLAIPLVAALTRETARCDASAARFVHWGATSQDVIDTGMVLQIVRALPSIDADLDRLEARLAQLTEQHAETVMAGRTFLQHAVPITFGLKAAGWLSAALRARRRLAEAGAQARVLQFGGAAGTLASLGSRGLKVAARLARDLDLALPELPWHSQRDRFCDLAAALGILAGGLGKLARDVALMMQPEVAEACEPNGAGKRNSSSMPHKQNPTASVVALAVATRVPGLVATMLSAMPQEHERGIGGWAAEWQTLPEIFRLVAAAARTMAIACEGLEVDTRRQRENLDDARGLVMAEAATLALQSTLERSAAHAIVDAASRRARAENRNLLDVLKEDREVVDHLDAETFARIADPERYLGMARQFAARVLAQRAALVRRR
jgi:3-carboxy-cis,cis-muconate cycloisomerase